MKRRPFTIFALLALFAVATAGVRAADGAAGSQAANNRIVFQVNEDDSKKWNTILTNINNVQEELGKVEITVVAIGPGLGMIKADALTANRVRDAMAAGARFVACDNSMRAMRLTRDDMIDGMAYARAGYVEIMRLQQLGYAYIRP